MRRLADERIVEVRQFPAAPDEVAVPFAVDKLAKSGRHAWIVSRDTGARASRT
jgi:hypothetical protein